MLYPHYPNPFQATEDDTLYTLPNGQIVILQDDRATTTVGEYWDCECKKNYIHSKVDYFCYRCGIAHHEHPDSRLDEILIELFGAVDSSELTVAQLKSGKYRAFEHPDGETYYVKMSPHAIAILDGREEAEAVAEAIY